MLALVATLIHDNLCLLPEEVHRRQIVHAVMTLYAAHSESREMRDRSEKEDPSSKVCHLGLKVVYGECSLVVYLWK